MKTNSFGFQSSFLETVVVEGEITIEAATVVEGVALSENLQLPPIVYHLVQEKCLEKLTRVQNDEAQKLYYITV